MDDERLPIRITPQMNALCQSFHVQIKESGLTAAEMAVVVAEVSAWVTMAVGGGDTQIDDLARIAKEILADSRAEAN